MRLIDATELESAFDELDWYSKHGTRFGKGARCESDAFFRASEVYNEAHCAKTIDAVPVVHGYWIDRPSGRYGQRQSWCSNCDKPSGIGGIESNRHKQYCPNCGARMDGDSDV